MISTTGGSGHHQRDKRSRYSHSGAANTGSSMTELNGENAATRLADDQQTPSKFSNGIGGLFKRLSPKYRSRSKSPAAHSQQRIEKTWVTVEIKDCHHPPSPVGASPMGNYAPPTTSSSSPSSPVLRNGGSTSPDKSPRLRGAWGNLFHRGSMKKPRDSSSGHKAAKIEARTRSEHELDGNGVDMAGVRLTSTHSTDLAGGRWRPAMTMPMNAAQRLTRENGGDIRDGLGATTAAIAARGTLSEEDLVSKSLSRERADVFKPIIPRGSTATGVQSSVPASLTAATTYHSQDSVFDSPARMPSYVRISCTLSGYRNYRNVDLKAAQSPKQVRSPPKLEPTAEIAQADHPIVTTPVIPIGKSIVERRLEKFEAQPSRQPAAAPATSPKEQTAQTVPALTEAAGTPTPIRDLISNFNKMSIHDPNSPSANRPRQKPPPIPPKRDRLLDKLEQAQDVPAPLHLENGLKECPVSLKVDGSGDGIGFREMVEASSQKKSIQNGVHEGHDAIFAAFPDSTTAERTVNGAFHREPVEDDVTTTVAERAVDAAVAEAMKHVSASFIQSHQLHPQHGPFMSQEEATTVEGSRLEEIVEQRTTTDVSQLEGAAANTMKAAGDGGDAVDSVKMATTDGYYYRAEAAKERGRLERLCAETEIDLGREDIPDEALERIRMAVGRVRLLLSKKFAKFEELIENNLHPTPDDPRPTHVSDLEGYFELVKMEIEDIDACFDVVQRLKANNWRAISIEAEETKNQSKSGPVASKGRQPPPRKGDKESSNARSEAAKQRLKEAKEAAMQRKKQAEAEGGFVPEEPVCPS